MPSVVRAVVLFVLWPNKKVSTVDDLTWVKLNTSQGATSCTASNQTHVFFSSFSFYAPGFSGFGPAILPDAVYRFSPQTQSLQGVISRADIVAPNGVRSDATGRYLYVTGEASPFNISGSPANSFGSAVIYPFELDTDCLPISKRLLATVHSYANGIHIEDYERGWKGEWNGS